MTGIDIRSLDIGMLRTLEALLIERNVSRAADRLFLSQSAVSSTLKRLRDVFGDPLFVRTAHGVEPTAHALLLAPYVSSALNEITRLLTAGKAFDPAQSNRIFRVISSDHLSQLILPVLCQELAQAQSGIRILWEPVNSMSPGVLQRGEADLGFFARMANPSGMLVQALYTDHYVLVARKDSLPDPITLQQFCAAPQVILSYGRSTLEELLDQVAARDGLQRYPQVAVTGFAQMVDLVARTDLTAVLPARVAATYAQQVQILPLPLEVPRYTLYMCSHLRSESDPGMVWLRETLARIVHARSLPAEGTAQAPLASAP